MNMIARISSILLVLTGLVWGQTQITVYNQDQALVKESLQSQLAKGTTIFSKADVAERLIPASVKLNGGEDLTVIEQNYQYDLVNQNQLLKKYLDAEVSVVQQNGDKLNGRLLSFDDRTLVLQGRTGLEIIQRAFVGSIRCPEPLEKMYTRPTLEWTLYAARAGKYDMELSYLTRGIGWKAEYVAELSADEQSLNLSSWIDLNNQSGATYKRAKLKLVAGELNQATQPQRDMIMTFQGAGAKRMAAVEEREFFEYHLYEIGFPVTIRNKEQKQVQWLSPTNIAARKCFIFEHGGMEFSNLPVKVRFKNDKETGTGVALPAGTVRLFKRDVDGALELVGEDWLDHTSKNDDVLLTLGEAFDVKGKREVLDRRTRQDRYREEDIRITIANRKDVAVDVEILEHLGWSNWEVKSPSHPFEKLDARRAQCNVQVPAGEEVVVTYTYYQNYR